MMPAHNLLTTTRGRLVTFGLLYISEGIPYGFSTTAMVAFMRTDGLSLEQIGSFVAALFIPWSFKWAWAPAIDVIKLNRFGGRKAWILLCTSMMIVTLLVTAAVDFVDNFRWLIVAIVLNNFFCATQGVAIDSLAVSTLREDERGRGNGFMFGGQYLGIALGGGGAIAVYGLWGLDTALTYVSVVLLAELIFVYFFVFDPDAGGERHKDEQFRRLAGAFRSFFRELYAGFVRSGPGPKVGLLFSVLPFGAIALAYATFATMNVDKGLDELELARISICATISSALGCLAGGVLSDRFGIKRMLGVYYALTALPTAYVAARIGSVGLEAIPLGEYYGAVVVYGLCFGMAFSQRCAIFMGMTNPAVAASQFTAYMAMGNVIIAISNYWQGIVADSYGYATVLYLDAALVCAPLLCIPFLRNREDVSEPMLVTEPAQG